MMDSTLAAALIATAAGVVSTLWSAGGRAALERRRIQQELSIAADVGASPIGDRLAGVARRRAELYLDRQLRPPRSPVFHVGMVALALVLGSLAGGLASVTNVGPTPVRAAADIGFVVLLVCAGSVVGVWLAELHRWGRRRTGQLPTATGTHPCPADGGLRSRSGRH